MKNEQIVLVTGLSGSGKSTALAALEDLGFFCIDNLPSAIVLNGQEMGPFKNFQKLAITMDSREKDFLSQYSKVLDQLKKQSHHFHLLFLEADRKILQKRFSVTRRRHPLGSGTPLGKAIELEIKELKDIRNNANSNIDTSNLTPHGLHQMIVDIFSKTDKSHHLEICVLSFGFYHGFPEQADLVVDVRFLINPHFVPKLQRFNGKNPEVKKFVLSHEDSTQFLDHYMSLLNFLIPRYQKEGKSYLTLAIGCTGGQHRSVVIAEEIFSRLKQQGLSCYLIHRDMELDK